MLLLPSFLITSIVLAVNADVVVGIALITGIVVVVVGVDLFAFSDIAVVSDITKVSIVLIASMCAFSVAVAIFVARSAIASAEGLVVLFVCDLSFFYLCLLMLFFSFLWFNCLYGYRQRFE